MALTDIKIRGAKPKEKPFKISDERGLYLEIAPSGGKWWRFKYRFDKKEKRLSLGVYPDITLAVARERRDEARRLLANGIDPSEHRKSANQAKSNNLENTFEIVAREWHAKQSKTLSKDYAEKVIRRFELHVFPWLGSRPIAEIKVPDLLKVLHRVEGTAIETAHRAMQTSGQVFRYAIATGRADYDITSGMRGALTPWRKVHFASITDPVKLGPLLRDMHGYRGTFPVRSALRIAPLVFLRPSELRLAEWSEFDLDNAVWNVPGVRMKMKKPHLVPLSRQVLAILEELRALTGAGQYVFAGRSNKKPISENTINAALQTLGYSTQEDMTGHGFRATARTILDEVLGFRPDIIEHQLAHAVRDPNGNAYNRTTFLTERREMMQRWADYLDGLRNKAGEDHEGPGA